MEMKEMNKEYAISAKELSKLVEERNEGSIRLLFDAYGGVDGLAKALKVDPAVGLTGADIELRKEIFGSNKLELDEPKGFFELCFEALQDPTLIILMLAATVSLGTGIYQTITTGHPEWIEGVAIIVTVFIVVMVAAGTDYAKEKQFRALNEIASDIKIDVQRYGQTMKISINDLVVGDVLWVKYGDLLPADAILVECQQLFSDESALTGEPVLIAKNLKEKPFILSGTKIMEGSGKAIVVAVGKYSQAGIIKSLAAGKDGIKSWQSLDGSVTVSNGSTSVTFDSGVNTKVIAKGTQIKIADVEYGVSKSDKKAIVLDRPYDGPTSDKVQISFLPSGDEEEESDSVLQGKLVILAGLIGQVGTFVSGAVFVLMTIIYLVKVFGFHDPSLGSFNWVNLLMFAITSITILVVAVPEGLPLAVTLSLAFSVKKMLHDNNLVKHLDACETMGSATTICSDKTGTLTTNRMTVMKGHMGLKFFDRRPEETFQEPAIRVLAECISLNSGKTSNVNDDPKSLSKTREYLGNKTECAMLNMLCDMKINYQSIRDDPRFKYPNGTKLFPFNSGLKRMSIVVPYGGGQRLYTKGASEIILGLCSQVLMSDGSVQVLSKEEKAKINTNCIDKLADEGFRTLSLAYKDLEGVEGVDWNSADQEMYENDLTLIAVLAIEDPLRDEVPGAIAQCNSAGIIVRMVTGDNIRTARSIAKKCGILPEAGSENLLVLEGPDFRKKVLDSNGNLLQGEFDKIWPRLRVLARSSPKDKYTLVTGLLNSELHKAKLKGLLDNTPDYNWVSNDRQVVAVTGDGTNDAPALSKADVGFAMGIMGTEVAKDACDIVILDDNFKSIVKAVLWGRNVYDSIAKFLQFQLTVNIVGITIAVVGALSEGESPLTAVQLLWVNLIMDALGSLALSTEPPHEDLLKRKPYGRNDPVLTKRMIKNILVGSIYQLAVVLFLLYGQISIPTLFMKYGTKVSPKDQSPLFEQCENQDLAPYTVSSPYNQCVTRVRNTVLFNAFVLMQLANEINARKLHDEINVFAGFFNNFIFISVVVVTLAIQILLVEFAGVAFTVEPLNGVQWGVCIAFGAGMLVWGVVMHLVPPCGKDQPTDVAASSIVAGAKDEIIRGASSQISLRNSRRLETASSNYRNPGHASTSRVLANARARISSIEAFAEPIHKGNTASAGPSAGLLV